MNIEYKIFFKCIKIKNQVKIVTNIGNVTEENLNQGVATDSLISNEEEKEGIERVVSRIQSIDQTITFKFKDPSNDNHIIDKNYLKQKQHHFQLHYLKTKLHI